MNNPRNDLVSLLAASCLAFAAGSAHAAEPLALQKIMKEMGQNMQRITDGISREDWEQVEKVAPLIADHPQPPLAEKMRIMRFVGTRMGTFKTYDGDTHDRAQAVGKAARAKDGPAVILAFQALQTTCYTCHSEFRKPFVAHFYGSGNTAR